MRATAVEIAEDLERRQLKSEETGCAVDGCIRDPRSDEFMCRDHWRLVPADVKRKVTAALESPDRRDWAEAAAEAVGIVEQREAGL